MKKLILLGIAACLVSAAMATTTFTGQTGLTVTPSAAVADLDKVNLSVGYNDADPDALYPIAVTYGVAENWEASANYLLNGKTVGIAGKWVTPLNYWDSKYAVGATIEKPAGDKAKLTYSLYGAMTKALPLDLEDVAVNANVNIGCVATDGVGLLNPAIGFDAKFAKAGDLVVDAEYIFRGSSYAVKASYDLGDGFGVQAGVQDTTDKAKIFAGVNYTYDLAK